MFTYITVDYYFYQSFKYHINNFVLRVITSDYAFETLGLNFNVFYYIIMVFLGFSCISIFLHRICSSLGRDKFWFVFSIKKIKLLYLFFFILICIDKIIF